MLENKKAPGGVEKPTRAGERSKSCIDCIIPQEPRQVLVSDLLHHGATNAVSARELSRILGWQPREVTRAVEYERRHGTPILACGNGYFLPANDVETDRYLRGLLHREIEIKRTRRAVEATRQQTIFGGVDRG